MAIYEEWLLKAERDLDTAKALYLLLQGIGCYLIE